MRVVCTAVVQAGASRDRTTLDYAAYTALHLAVRDGFMDNNIDTLKLLKLLPINVATKQYV